MRSMTLLFIAMGFLLAPIRRFILSLLLKSSRGVRVVWILPRRWKMLLREHWDEMVLFLLLCSLLWSLTRCQERVVRLCDPSGAETVFSYPAFVRHGAPLPKKSMNTRYRYKLWSDYEAIDFSVQQGVRPLKYFIYRCPSGQPAERCGDLLEKINGVVFSYLVANLTHRAFKMDSFLDTCTMTDYIVPNHVDWRLNETFHRQVENPSNVKVRDHTGDYEFLKRLPLTDMRQFAPENASVVYFSGNLNYINMLRGSRLYHRDFAKMWGMTTSEITAAVYKHLIRPSRSVQERLDLYLKTHLPTYRYRLSCVSLEQSSSPVVDNNRMKKIHKVWDFLRNVGRSRKNKIVVMTDLSSFARSFKMQKFRGGIGLVIPPEDSNTGGECSRTRERIFGLHLLMNCDTLVVNGGGIGLLAAHVRGTDRGLQCFLANGTFVSCRREELEFLFASERESKRYNQTMCDVMDWPVKCRLLALLLSIVIVFFIPLFVIN